MAALRFSWRKLGPVLALAGAISAPAVHACPSQLERAERREEAREIDVADSAALDAAWRWQVDAAAACADVEAQADALGEWAGAAQRGGDSERSFRLESERYVLAKQHGLTLQAGKAAVRLGQVLSYRGQIDVARHRLNEARELFELADDRLAAANASTDLSRMERRLGNYLAALHASMASLRLRRELPPPSGMWRSQLNLAVLFEQIEHFDEARIRYTEALAEVQAEGSPIEIADVQSQFAGFLNDFGGNDATQALALAQSALPARRLGGDPAKIGPTLLQVARAQLHLGQHDLADAAFDEAEHLARSGQLKALLSHLDFRRGEAWVARGQRELGLARIERARDSYREEGNRHRLIKVYAALEQIYQSDGDTLAAAQAGREHFRLRNELLGTGSSGQFGELLTNVALNEARARNVVLAQRNEMSSTRLESALQQRLAWSISAGIGLLMLLVLAWRHVSTRRLYRLLSEKTRLIEQQRLALEQSNQQLLQRSRELLEASQTDALTHLRNRGFGMSHLRNVLDQHDTPGQHPAIVMIDVDHFKAINDSYGHQAGDQVLISVSACLRQAVPTKGEVIRFGGEEFMVVLSHVEDGEAERLAESLRCKVRELRVDVGSCIVRVTISLGVSTVSDGQRPTLQALISRTDQALYRAKHEGRDCVRVAEC